MHKLAMMLLLALIVVPIASAETELVRFTPGCEFTVTFPGKISIKSKNDPGKTSQDWQHVRDIEFLSKHYEISAICQPLDPRGREYELLMFYRNMEKEARRVQITKPHTDARQDMKHRMVMGEWKGYTRDYAKKPVTVEGRHVLGRQSKLLLMVATPGTHPEPSALIADFFKSIRRK